MSGSIITANGVSWRAAGWVFRNILDRTADVLTEQGHESLAHLITDEEGEIRSVESFELADLTEGDRSCFFHALQLCYQRLDREGSSNWTRPEFFPGFMDRFKALIDTITAEKHG